MPIHPTHPRTGANMTVEEYLEQALLGFVNDPPDSLYQEGFLAGLLSVADNCDIQFAIDVLKPETINAAKRMSHKTGQPA